MYVLLSSGMESEFEIPGHGSDYCIILVSKLKLLALLFSSVICIFKKHRCLTCHHYCGFSVLHFQYWLAKKISAAWTTVQTTDSSVLFTVPSPEVTKGPKQPYTCSIFKVHHNAANEYLFIQNPKYIQNTVEARKTLQNLWTCNERWWIQNKLMNCYIVSFI